MCLQPSSVCNLYGTPSFAYSAWTRSEREIVFVRGTTEAINLVASGTAQSALRPGDEIVITAMEHHSNIVPWQMVCEATGASLVVAAIDEDGALDMDDYRLNAESVSHSPSWWLRNSSGVPMVAPVNW